MVADDRRDIGAESSVRQTTYGRIADRPLVREMEQSYLDYAMSVIVARALPDVRDGLKPVHRRVLYAMWEDGRRWNSKFSKCAGIVGEVMKKYHPHGDMAIYDTLVRLAQGWSMRYRLVDGQGNFGSIDNDPPAAMRYTEARLHRLADELLTDIDKNTVDFSPNYDGSFVEPTVLPATLPNLLLNGAQGIAVGMATNIPPHNLKEVIAGLIWLIDQPDADIDALMEHIKGPDFPTGAAIFDHADIKAAYATGKGSIVARATAEIVEKKNGFAIIVTALPYQVNKAALIAKIAELHREKRIDGVTDIRDESDRQSNVRVVIELKATAYPKKVLNRLYDLTPMQTAFHVNMLALVGGIQPQVLTLKQVLENFIVHRRQVVHKRVEFDWQKARDRAHILAGLLIALDDIDAVIALIRASRDREEAKSRLINQFKLSSSQSDAILDMRLAQLAALERQKIEDEYAALERLISELAAILADESKISAIIKDELSAISGRFGDERKTVIHPGPAGQFSAADLIPDEPVVVAITRGNYIKRLPSATYHVQQRGGKGVVGMTTKEEDEIDHLASATTHSDIYFFTNAGRVFLTKVYEIPAASRQAKGTPLVNVIPISSSEKVTAAMVLNDIDETKKYFIFATRLGQVKRTAVAAYATIRKTGMVATRINSGDQLKWVRLSAGDDYVFQATAKGQAISYREDEIRPVGRAAGGVKGINLRSGDEVIAMDIVSGRGDPNLLIVLENGFGKRTAFRHFRTQHRAGLGLKCANVTTKTGQVVASEVVIADETRDILLISKQGVVIRMPLRSVRRLGRDTQGVTLMRLADSDTVASVTVLDAAPVAGDFSPPVV